MALKKEWVNFGASGEWRGYLARMESAQPLPAVLLIQEAWGVDAHIQDVALRLAQAGYLVLAPDLYAKDGLRPLPLQPERIEEAKSFLNSLPPGAWGVPAQRAEGMARLSDDAGARIQESMDLIFGGISTGQKTHLHILNEAVSCLRHRPESQGAKIGSLGFCMGGGLSGLMAAGDAGLAGAVIFYGHSIPSHLVPQLSCPVLALHGATDKRLVDGLPEFVHSMREAHKSLETQVYTGAGHAFFNDTRPSYDAAASRDAWAKTLSFLNQCLQ